MLFSKETYSRRRRILVEIMREAQVSGILVFLQNIEVPNQAAEESNGFDFRSDSNWLYYFGIDKPRYPANNGYASEAFIKAVISQRLVKEDVEIEELDLIVTSSNLMHEAGRAKIQIGANENDICASMDEVSRRLDWGRAFATILTRHGEIHHNHRHYNQIEPGRLLVVDAGTESFFHYASDLTRTYPTSGKFSTKQREIYQIVYECNELAFQMAKPGITYLEVHLATARKMLECLSALGLVHGDLDEMVANGIAGLLIPHGLGYNMGLNAHDMEDHGENLVGYDPDQQRAKQLGLGNLRMARRLVPGYVVTDEPGIYFTPPS